MTATSVGAAGAPPTDVGNDSVQCDQITGKIVFAPPLVDGGTAPAAAQVKLKVSDCTDDLQPTGVVTGATVLGTLTLPSNDCASLEGLQAWSGSLSVKWHPASGVKLSTIQSTIALTQVAGGAFGSGVPTGDATAWGGQYGLVQFGTDPEKGATAAPVVTGAFTGGNAGADSTLDFVTNQSVDNIQAACASVNGLSKIDAGLGSLTLN